MEYVSKFKFSFIGVILALLSWLSVYFSPLTAQNNIFQICLLLAVSLVLAVLCIFVDWYVLRLKKSTAAEVAEVYRATVWSSHLVLNNFLNKLYLIQHYAIQNGAFTEELSESMSRMIQEAAAELLELSRADPVTPENIRSTVAPK